MGDIAVTGIGVADCFGQDVLKSIDSLKRGISGVAPLTETWAGCLPGMQGASAAEAPIRDILPNPKQLKYMNVESRLAVAAAARALEDSGFSRERGALENLGLFVSTGLLSVDLDKVLPAVAASHDSHGCISMELLGRSGLRKVNPILPFHLLSNMPLCHVSIALGLTGANTAVYPGVKDGWEILKLAVHSIVAGRMRAALVGGAVHQVSLLPLGHAVSSGNTGGPPGVGAAFTVLEAADSALDRGARIYGFLSEIMSVNEVGVRAKEPGVRAGPETGPEKNHAVVDGGSGMTLDVDRCTGHLGAAAPVYALTMASALAGETGRKTFVRVVDPLSGFRASADLLPPSSRVGPGVRATGKRRVVITGVGVWSPIGTSWEEYKYNLTKGTSGIGAISHFDASSFPVRIAGEAPDVDLHELDLPDKERTALVRDRKSAFGLAAARQAMGDAFPEGIDRSGPDHSRRTVVMAAGLEVFHLEDLSLTPEGELDLEEMKSRYLSRPAGTFMQMPADLGTRLANSEWGALGPVLTNVSACAASTQAIGQACEMVQDGIADAVLCGGYDSMINPLGVGGFAMLGALSESNGLLSRASRPFHPGRDGFVLGEGAAALILEEREAAVGRGARIYGEVTGYATTLDAYHLTDPRPDGEGAAQAFRRALADAGIGPDKVDYISAHGTGTPKNDPMEAMAIRKVFGKEADRIPVSSTKSQVGHLIAAAGAVEFLAGLQAFESGILPATITLDEVDPECELNHIAEYPVHSSLDVFLKSSFGFGGQNAVLVCRRWEGA